MTRKTTKIFYLLIHETRGNHEDSSTTGWRYTNEMHELSAKSKNSWSLMDNAKDAIVFLDQKTIFRSLAKAANAKLATVHRMTARELEEFNKRTIQ